MRLKKVESQELGFQNATRRRWSRSGWCCHWSIRMSAAGFRPSCFRQSSRGINLEEDDQQKGNEDRPKRGDYYLFPWAWTFLGGKCRSNSEPEDCRSTSISSFRQNLRGLRIIFSQAFRQNVQGTPTHCSRHLSRSSCPRPELSFDRDWMSIVELESRCNRSWKFESR